jgi:hypothetical protein
LKEVFSHMIQDATGMIEKTIDARINYPCYKSFDEFINVTKLKSLDDYLTEKILARLKLNKDSDFLNAHRLSQTAPHKPGTKEIWLTRTAPERPYNYFDLDKPGVWHPTEDAAEFPALMDFIGTLPFQTTGRILIIYDTKGAEVPAHRDHLNADLCHEFIWFRTNLEKPFYMLNHKTGEKVYVRSYSAWFDSVNQFHGVDAKPGFSFSFRVDGKFTEEFKKQIPKPALNLASTPALWSFI